MKPPNYPIESVDNALRLLLSLLDQQSMTVSDASGMLGVAPSTAHRLLAMLQYRGFVDQDTVTKRYRSGPVLLKLGLTAVRQMDLRRHARPILERLSKEIAETVNLVVLQGADVLFVDCVESPRIIRVSSRTGVLLPAHCTAGGKALLADLSRDEFRGLYPDAKLSKMTAHSLTRRSRLQQELEEIRARGYATNFGESESGLSAVAVAVRDGQGRPLGALAASAPNPRLADERVEEIAKALLQGAKDIGESLA
ncbi:MAG: IclR family transcriptional regulator [Euzebyales bacterium]|nr:IclR family transcriptional regulator [Euzebyales bacterium]